MGDSAVVAGATPDNSSDARSAHSRVHPTAEVADSARVGDRCAVWQYAHIRENAALGDDCVVGRGAYIGPGVQIGARCKVQSYALVYDPAVLEDGVFLGPAAVLTNDLHPRAVNADGSVKSGEDWQQVAVYVETGASIGARAVCVAPVRIGAWSMVAAGAVVVADVARFALVAGTPARQIGWVGEAGVRLVEVGPSLWQCPASRSMYDLVDGALRRVSEADHASTAAGS